MDREGLSSRDAVLSSIVLHIDTYVCIHIFLASLTQGQTWHVQGRSADGCHHGWWLQTARAFSITDSFLLQQLHFAG